MLEQVQQQGVDLVQARRRRFGHARLLRPARRGRSLGIRGPRSTGGTSRCRAATSRSGCTGRCRRATPRPPPGWNRDAKSFLHPDVGALTLTYQAFDVRDVAGQQFVIYHAEPGSPSAQSLDLLGAIHATRRQTASRFHR
ncbi:hypothetical protein [Actinomadura nitritigenes]|uniref:MmyB family transcriptional regulator n=1 Tax=Actinomadura nitritigenes TaxID=134602 RepID=UPI003D8D10A2